MIDDIDFVIQRRIHGDDIQFDHDGDGANDNQFMIVMEALLYL